MRFHRRCGDRVTLLNDNSAAVRNFVEFNHGLILSAEPLQDDVMFEVCIDRKVNVWNGSLEIGVTTLDPEFMELPATATKLRNTAWIMSGSSIVKDGVTLVNSYGPELDTLREGDCVGVMRTNKGELLFYVNGRCLGVAVHDMPPRLFAVIDLYGQCVQVTIMNTSAMRPTMESSLDQIEDDPNNDDTLTSSELEAAADAPQEPSSKEVGVNEMYGPHANEGACSAVPQGRLRFHPRCGILVKLTANNKTAERARPLDDYNNGVVMTHRPLYDNELFEIRIDRLVDKWSGSIEVGVTTHNPATIRFPSTMTNMDSGTIMMSGCKILVNGQGSCSEYGNINLDELREGDAVGMIRKGDGKLHYYINGIDQGVAMDKIDSQVWGVIDLYGMTVKVTIIDPCEDVDSNIHVVPMLEQSVDSSSPGCFRPRVERIDEDSLLFHTLRDSNVIILNDGKTAHRPNAFEFFNNGIIMTNRTLKTDELFQVRLDLVIPKWAGSIEIGVTQHSCNEIEFPFKMSNAKSGTWAMTGEDVIRDGTIIIPQYVRNLNKLMEGDTVGVMRKEMGNMGVLHFFVNGIDQGPAAFNIPEHVFGVIDLYGRVAQATIVDYYVPPPSYSPESPLSTESNGTVYPEMCFHRVHGRNARLSRNRLTASRATVYSEFNDAVLFSSRPLRECEMFELRIDKMVDCWIGSLEIGVTAIKPEELEGRGGVGAVAGTATDLNWDTYILSGAAMMKDGECVRSGYTLDLDSLTIGSRVGMMWHADRCLHYYLDGMDQGKAWYVPHLNIYAIVDLYGQCTQVTILQNEERQFNYNGLTYSDNSLSSYRKNIMTLPPPYCFSEYCGENVALLYDYSFARRLTTDPMASLVFSCGQLVVDETFEVKITECTANYAGGLRMGVTDINVLNAHVNRNFPPSVCYLPHYTAYVDGRLMRSSRPGRREHDLRSVSPCFEWLRPGDRVGLKKTSDGRVLIYYNSEQLDAAFENVPDKVYVVMELFGYVYKIQAISKLVTVGTSVPQPTVSNECTNVQETTVTTTVAPSNLVSLTPVAPVTVAANGAATSGAATGDTILSVAIASTSGATAASSGAAASGAASSGAASSGAASSGASTSGAATSGVCTNDTVIFGASTSGAATCGASTSGTGSRGAINDGASTSGVINYGASTSGATTSAATTSGASTSGNSTSGTTTGGVSTSSASTSGATAGGASTSGATTSGASTTGVSTSGATANGSTTNGATNNGASTSGATTNGVTNNGASTSGATTSGASTSEATTSGATTSAASIIGAPNNDVSTSGAPTGGITTGAANTSGAVSSGAATSGASTSGASTSGASTSGAGTSGATTSGASTSGATTSGTTAVLTTDRRRRHPLPYTFHYVHGKNIKLTSSDTVAMRTAGYKDAVAVVSQPLRRGHNFRFRIDKVGGEWSGSVTIGAVGTLPADSVPSTALAFEPPVWVASSELICNNGSYSNSRLAACLEELVSQSVLCLHFRFNSELVLAVDGKPLGVVAVVPRSLPHVYPVIDLYGKVYQVSVLLHPYVVASGASVDLPIITEHVTEDSLEEEQDLLPDCEVELELEPTVEESRSRKTVKAHSEEIVVETHPELDQPSTSAAMPAQHEDSPPSTTPPTVPEPKAKDVDNRNRTANKLALHQSFILRDHLATAETNDEVNRSIQKSHSTNSFLYYGDGTHLQPDIPDRRARTFVVDTEDEDEDEDDEDFIVPERFCDTNIQHNDRYPEASDVDNLDNEIVSALILDGANLPDLTEEQSSSIDESTRRDELDDESLCSENLRYLSRLISLSQEAEEAETDWEVSGEGCEHLHLVLKFWSYLMMPYPDLRRAVTNWGRVLCYCSNCKPDAEPQYAGWVCIERTAVTDETRRRFWHVDRSTVAFAQAAFADEGGFARPRLASAPHIAATPSDIWFDEEGKPNHTILALEIETESQPDMDRLVSFLIYLRPHVPDEAPAAD